VNTTLSGVKTLRFASMVQVSGLVDTQCIDVILTKHFYSLFFLIKPFNILSYYITTSCNSQYILHMCIITTFFLLFRLLSPTLRVPRAASPAAVEVDSIASD